MVADHGAAAAALGYLYQSHWALLELLRQGKERADQELTLELHDDVAFGKGSKPEKLLQLKHHTKAKPRDLADTAPDIWRTINVWVDDPKFLEPEGPTLVLVTTSVAGEGSAAWYLRDNADRDPQRACDLLVAAADASDNKKSEAVRSRWLLLKPEVRLQFVSRIYVADGEISIGEVEAAVESLLRYALPMEEKKQELFLAQIWRWWYAVSLDLLLRRRRAVTPMEARRHIETIRNTFANDDLPTTVELADLDEVELMTEHSSSVFVQQLKIVGAGQVTLQKAVMDYHRAVTQETHWLQTTLVDLAELQTFENKVVDEWERAHARMLEDLGDDAEDAVKRKAGLDLYRQVSDSGLKIRKYYSEEFHSRGKRHQLANKRTIGWHPDFEARLRELTVGRDGATS